jgi:sulfatase modifying factor 1
MKHYLFFGILLFTACTKYHTAVNNSYQCPQTAEKAAQTPPSRIPPGMVWVPSGCTLIGDSTGLAPETPPFWMYVPAFFMDEHPVTVAEFRAFTSATKYITDAESFGNAGVLDYATGTWGLVDSATWHHPFGPKGPAAPDNHPVTQVSLRDAQAYAAWAGKQIPTEFEWEHAARNGKNSRDIYPTGNTIQESTGRWQLNIWQGEFPYRNTGSDKYLYTSPVGAFGKTPLGLTDMSGNIWEWTDSPKTNYKDLKHSRDSTEYVQKGGSFLCNVSYCHGYRVSSRSFCTPETSLFHVGFRCILRIS